MEKLRLQTLPEAVDFPGPYPESPSERMLDFARAALMSLKKCAPLHYAKLANKGVIFEEFGYESVALLVARIESISGHIAINAQNLELISLLLCVNVYISNHKGTILIRQENPDFKVGLFVVRTGSRHFAGEPIM